MPFHAVDRTILRVLTIKEGALYMYHFEIRQAGPASRLPQSMARRCLSWAVLVAVLPAVPAIGMGAELDTQSVRKASLNDTGLTQCVVFDEDQGNYIFTPECAGTGHDGEFGRDALLRRDADGHAGFSFEKIGANGEVLPRNATSWTCIRDKVTGSMWEVKTQDGGPRDVGARFTNLGNGKAGDASAYVTTVNAAGLCGAHDWRLPTRREMESLVDFSVPEGGPMIDGAWFPNTASDFHWTSTSAQVNGGSADYRWAVSYYKGESIWYGGEFGNFAVRLVRLGRAVPVHHWVLDGAEARDKSTGLIWRRCAEGQAWTGQTCSGTSTTFLTNSEAFDHAKEQANSSGKAWRVPNVKELSSVVDTRRSFPSIDPSVFPGFQPETYHGGTHWTENEVYTWRVQFGRGNVMLDHWGGKLLLVRDAD